MKTKINTTEYSQVDSMVIYGITFETTYNHIYHYNKFTEDVILEESDDDQTCYYYRIEIKGHSFVKTYLGHTDDQYGQGIFDKYYEGYPSRNENGEVELDNTLS